MGEDVNDDAVPPDWLLAQIADLRQAATDLREMPSRSEWQQTVDNPPWRQWEWVAADGGASGALTRGPAGWKIDLVDGDRKVFMRALESASDIADEVDNYLVEPVSDRDTPEPSDDASGAPPIPLEDSSDV